MFKNRRSKSAVKEGRMMATCNWVWWVVAGKGLEGTF